MSDNQSDSDSIGIIWSGLNYHNYWIAQQLLVWIGAKAENRKLYELVLLTEFRKALRQFIEDYETARAIGSPESDEYLLSSTGNPNNDFDDNDHDHDHDDGGGDGGCSGVELNFGELRIDTSGDW